MRRTDTPTISIVVASNHSRAQLNACLDSLLPQCERVSAELIVVRAATKTEALVLGEIRPGAHLVVAPTSATVRELRAMGMAEASGDIVAFVTDDRVPDDSFVASLQRRIGRPAAAR